MSLLAHPRSTLASTGRARESLQPLMEMNTTPLIDVMLVLLVMLIITMPMQTHAVKIDLPTTGPVRADPIRNRLDVSASGSARWNGRIVDDRALTGLFGQVATMDRPAEIHFKPDARVRYERVDDILAMAKRSGVTTLGFVGNEAYRASF
jgi:biopolymer transport protein ExbD